MKEQEIIKALKENEKPFGLMSEEMQAAMKSVADDSNIQFWNICEWVKDIYPTWDGQNTYRLRPDYDEKPEIVEYKYATKLIDEDFYVEGYIYEDSQFHRLANIPDGYKPSGYKYKDGSIHLTSTWHTGPRDMTAKDFFNAGNEVLTPTHVIFRKTD